MISVGIRELKEKLSGYLEHVRNGEEVVITDRGREIAVVVPISRERNAVRLLVKEGRATWGGGKPSGGKGVAAKGEPLSDTVLEDRR